MGWRSLAALNDVISAFVRFFRMEAVAFELAGRAAGVRGGGTPLLLQTLV